MPSTEKAVENPPEYNTCISSALLAKFKDLMAKYEIRSDLVTRLRTLEDYDIVFVCDDSGSMSSKCALADTDVDPYAPRQSRWDELKNTVRTVVDIAVTLDSDGIDVYFLNQGPPLCNVTSVSEVDRAFAEREPKGYTPLERTLRQVLIDKAHRSSDFKKLLIVVATDGEPTTVNGQVDRSGVRQFLMHERPNYVYVTIAAMTDDEEVMKTLDSWDESLQRLDVVDDYASEKQQIRSVQGPLFPFSRGDYICKILLGTIDPWVDSWDETRIELPPQPQGYARFYEPNDAVRKKKRRKCTIL